MLNGPPVPTPTVVCSVGPGPETDPVGTGVAVHTHDGRQVTVNDGVNVRWYPLNTLKYVEGLVPTSNSQVSNATNVPTIG